MVILRIKPKHLNVELKKRSLEMKSKPLNSIPQNYELRTCRQIHYSFFSYTNDPLPLHSNAPEIRLMKINRISGDNS